ncbi:MAG: S41 family peptidase [Leptospiraceae bacterium]|nr:S41 family peptidase [Leptospiraceae bacterium]MDW7975147.1 S41 family peptidase [Leptospiraceae bacterium]
MKFAKSIFVVLIGFSLYFTFCGCNQAETREIPSNFGRREFDEIINYALNHYYDPKLIDSKRAYINAAEFALKSLPYGLAIYPEEFYKNVQNLIKPERIVEGNIIKIQPEDSYVIIEPNYELLEAKNKAREEELRKLDPKQRLELNKKTQEEIRKEQQILDSYWDKTSFNREDFLKVIQFIENNLEKYSQPPKTAKTKNNEKHPNFGMNIVYFTAANGFLASFDPHSGLIDLKSWERMRKESEDSSFEGIGALLRGGGISDVVVETPLPGSPALNAGLRAGDIIRKVNGESISNLPLNEVVKRIRGPKDTIVELEIERPTEMKTYVLRIKRGVIEQKAVSSIYLPETIYYDFIKMKIGIIKITSFLFDKVPQSEMIRKEFYNLMEKSEGKLEGLIIDLRNNPGGDLDEAIKVAGLFLPERSVVVEIRGKNNQTEKRYSSQTPLVVNNKKIPVVVLVNASSASASEIFASALMDHNAALIVGERTFGKATVQGIRRMNDVLIKITTARYYAPNGYTIQVYGVEPDILISDEFDNSFPPKFREEDMWQHLPQLEKRQPDPNREEWVKKLQTIAKPWTIKAEEFLKQHQHDAIKPDAMLIRALPYIKVMKLYPNP